LTGVLANPDMLLYIGTDKEAPGINATGWYYGNFTQLLYQAVAALFIIVLNAVATFVILKVIGRFVPLRMDEKSLQIGDLAVHGEVA
jgi:Amt family ammonium transporter